MGDLYGLEHTESEPLVTKRTTRSSTSPQSLTTITNLPGISSQERDRVILQAAVLVEDGINYRSISHKLDPDVLKIYRLYYSPGIQWALAFVIFLNLMLAFLEHPNSLSISSDPTIRPHVGHLSDYDDIPCGVTEAIEFITLVLFSVDCVSRAYLLGWRRFLKRKWLILYLLMLLVSFPDMFVSLGFCIATGPKSLGSTLRIRRYFRPLILLLSSSIMKKYIKAIKLTLPQIFNVLILLVLHLYVFTMVGLLIFPSCPKMYDLTSATNSTNESLTPLLDFCGNCSDDEFSSTCFRYREGEKYFQTAWDGFVNLTVTLTTANHPDIMMPIYRRNRFAAIYFIIFLMIGLFLLFNVLIAVIYNQFKGFFQKSLQSSFFRRRVGFHAAFTILAKKTRVAGGSNLELVSRDLVRLLLQNVKVKQKFIPGMYERLETMEVESDCIRWKQFCQVFDMVSHDPHQRKQQRPEFLYSNRLLAWVQFAIRHRYTRWFSHVVTILNLVIITVVLQWQDHISVSLLPKANFFFIMYYIVEQLSRLTFFGYRQYFSSWGNIYDIVIAFVLVLLQVSTSIAFLSPFNGHINNYTEYDNLMRLMNIVIVLRLLRIIPHVKQLWILTNTMLELVKNLRGFAGIIVVVYYIFALLGMELFAEMEIVSPNSTNVCGSFDNLEYYANNFNDFASSLVVLWDIMIVNNWYVFLDKFALDSHLHEFSKLFFIAWWLVSVVVCVNLFISLVLETFLLQWEVIQRKTDQEENGEIGRYGESSSYSTTSSEGQEVTDIHILLSSKLEEPHIADIMYELQQHRELQLA